MRCGICKREIPKKQVRIDNMHYEFEEEIEKLFTADRQDSITICQKCYENLIWDQKEAGRVKSVQEINEEIQKHKEAIKNKIGEKTQDDKIHLWIIQTLEWVIK